MKSIAIATSQEYLDLNPDDLIFLEYLKKDFRIVPAVWNDPTIRWAEFDGIMIRSCWDAHIYYEEYEKWLKKIAPLNVWNPVSVLQWGFKKRYLLELASKGISIIPTEFVFERSKVQLLELMREKNWSEIVIKPEISASAFETFRGSSSNMSEVQAEFDRINKMRPCLIQSFMPEIQDEGELSFLFFEKEFHYAIRKKPNKGDFRSQRDFGARSERFYPDPEIVDQARRVVNAVDSDLLYARVDVVVRQRKIYLMELEVLDPNLFLEHVPEAAISVAEKVKTRFS